MSDFYPLEVVGRGSETQLEVGENLTEANNIPLPVLVMVTLIRVDLFKFPLAVVKWVKKLPFFNLTPNIFQF